MLQPINLKTTPYYSMTENYKAPRWEDISREWFTVSFLSESQNDAFSDSSNDWDSVMERIMIERREAWNILADL